MWNTIKTLEALEDVIMGCYTRNGSKYIYSCMYEIHDKMKKMPVEEYIRFGKKHTDLLQSDLQSPWYRDSEEKAKCPMQEEQLYNLRFNQVFLWFMAQTDIDSVLRLPGYNDKFIDLLNKPQTTPNDVALVLSMVVKNSCMDSGQKNTLIVSLLNSGKIGPRNYSVVLEALLNAKNLALEHKYSFIATVLSTVSSSSPCIIKQGSGMTIEARKAASRLFMYYVENNMIDNVNDFLETYPQLGHILITDEGYDIVHIMIKNNMTEQLSMLLTNPANKRTFFCRDLPRGMYRHLELAVQDPKVTVETLKAVLDSSPPVGSFIGHAAQENVLCLAVKSEQWNKVNLLLNYLNMDEYDIDKIYDSSGTPLCSRINQKTTPSEIRQAAQRYLLLQSCIKSLEAYRNPGFLSFFGVCRNHRDQAQQLIDIIKNPRMSLDVRFTQLKGAVENFKVNEKIMYKNNGANPGFMGFFHKDANKTFGSFGKLLNKFLQDFESYSTNKQGTRAHSLSSTL